ncbi:MAG TPA: heparinase II/III family protein [Armatimonadota bacterium]|nr:heparinase II/III family protein [Armatimonadota bacterium]
MILTGACRAAEWHGLGGLAVIIAICAMFAARAGADAKTNGVYCGASMIQNAKWNAAAYPWAAQIRDQVTAAAQPWLKFTDDELWDLMFGHTISRSWMVLSNGHCPACERDVPMYTWEMDALARPWKVRCPHCKELFPKNDFHKFYLSGLDEHGVFDPQRADRTLLFNQDHPDPNDPLYRFGVDDGEGYVNGDKRWRFIGAYLVFGQWKQAVLAGIRSLAAAYVVTGDPVYAHKAGVLLDRTADLYPTFDFGKEGWVYEEKGSAGYVSTWHDACVETRDLAYAYDYAFAALQRDPALVTFLSRKAKQYKLDNPKASFADIQRNIEDRILRDALVSRGKIYSNYPQTDLTATVIETVLGWPGNREEVYGALGAVISKSTAVDGMTGEKGLSGYSAYAAAVLAQILEQYARMDNEFLPQIFKRYPRLHQMFRFHVETWCLFKYYPTCGDAGIFAGPIASYAGVWLSKNNGINPSMFTFLWRICQLTGDAAFAQIAYRANGNSTRDLPYDIFCADPAAAQKEVGEVVARAGAAPKVGSVNKQEWHLAILRSGHGADERDLWLDYDAGGGHGHADGMNLGLFAKGLDLLPDFGYPPVQYGGWMSPRARWYGMSAAHNTVVVDGNNQQEAAGHTTLWGDGKGVRVMRASGPRLIGGRQFERTAALIDISDRDSYVLDIFRVVGGADHARFTYSQLGSVTTSGLSLHPAPDYGHDTQTCNFSADPSPAPEWSADWKVDDRRHLLPPGADVHLRVTDLTAHAQALIGQAWISLVADNAEAWIPVVISRRQGKGEPDQPLASTFVSVIEPYERTSNIAAIRRLPLVTPRGDVFPDQNVAVEVRLADGRRDLVVAADVENPLKLRPSRTQGRALVQPDWKVQFNGDLAMIRTDATGRPLCVALCGATSLRLADARVELAPNTPFVEIAFDPAAGRAWAVAGSADAVRAVTVGDADVWQR